MMFVLVVIDNIIALFFEVYECMFATSGRKTIVYWKKIEGI